MLKRKTGDEASGSLIFQQIKSLTACEVKFTVPIYDSILEVNFRSGFTTNLRIPEEGDTSNPRWVLMHTLAAVNANVYKQRVYWDRLPNTYYLVPNNGKPIMVVADNANFKKPRKRVAVDEVKKIVEVPKKEVGKNSYVAETNVRISSNVDEDLLVDSDEYLGVPDTPKDLSMDYEESNKIFENYVNVSVFAFTAIIDEVKNESEANNEVAKEEKHDRTYKSTKRKIEMLDKNNYASWIVDMQMLLEDKEMWDYTSNRPYNDREVFRELRFNVSQENRLKITKAGSMFGNDAWVTLQKYHEGTGATGEIDILSEFFKFKYHTNDNIDSHFSKFTNMVNKLNRMNLNFGAKVEAVLLINSLPERYNGIIDAWKANNTLPSVEQVMEKIRLKSKEFDSIDDSVAQALSADKKRGKVRQNSDNKRNNKSVRCYNCNKVGHIKRNCRSNQDHMGMMVMVKKENKNDKARYTSNDCLEWYIDSGASSHLCGNSKLMHNFKECGPFEVTVANGDKLMCDVKGDIDIKGIGTIKDVFFVPGLSKNLLSVSTLINTHIIKFSKGYCDISKNDNDQVTMRIPIVNGMFVIQGSSAFAVNVKRKISLETAHRIFGHCNNAKLLSMYNNGQLNFELTNKNDFECKICLENKLTRNDIPKQSSIRNSVNVLLHTDLWVSPITSIEGYKYLLVIVEDRTKYVMTFPLKTKNEVVDKLKAVHKMMDVQLNKKIAVIRSDNGGEYVNKDMLNFCLAYGIHHERTLPYSSFQNGVAERSIRTIIEMTRTLLAEADFKENLWPLATSHATMLRNLIVQKDQSTIPYILFWNKAPDYSRLFRFGATVYCRIPLQHRNKLQNVAWIGKYVGIDKYQNGIRVLKDFKTVVVVRDYHVSIEGEKTLSYKPMENENDKIIVEISDSDSDESDDDSDIDYQDDNVGESGFVTPEPHKESEDELEVFYTPKSSTNVPHNKSVSHNEIDDDRIEITPLNNKMNLIKVVNES